jgi:phosphoserine phosphatase RsbU/P
VQQTGSNSEIEAGTPPGTGPGEAVTAPASGARSTASWRDLPEELVGRHGRYAAAFDNLIVGLIVLSVASIGIEALPNLPGWAQRTLRGAEVVIVAVFSIEYLLRLLVAPRKLAFVLSFQGIVDLLAIAPFFLLGFDARWIRVLRLLRLLRLLKLQTHYLEATVAERTRELARQNAALEAAQAELKTELDAARALQLAILPARFPAPEGCDGAARMLPATTMCGDFYDFLELADGRIGVVIADVSGHGVPAAFFMAVARTELRDVAARNPDPGTCLALTNRALCAENPMDLFVTVFYGVFDPASGILCYANGGHNPPLLRHADQKIEGVRGKSGPILGVMSGAQFPTHTLELQPGDCLLLYTDGLTEACNAQGEFYGEQRLAAELVSHGGAAPGELIERLCRSVAAFAGTAAQADDITISVLARGPP